MNEISGDEKERGSGRSTALALKYAYLAIKMKNIPIVIKDHYDKINSHKSLRNQVQRIFDTLSVKYEIGTYANQEVFIKVIPL